MSLSRASILFGAILRSGATKNLKSLNTAGAVTQGEALDSSPYRAQTRPVRMDSGLLGESPRRHDGAPRTGGHGISRTRARWLFITLVVLVAAAAYLGTGTAYAASGSDDRVDEPAAPPQQDAQDSDPEANLPYLFAVYIITWGGFFAYVFYMSRRQREMQRELDALKRALNERDQAAVTPGTASG